MSFQSTTVTFNGTQDFIDVVWPVEYQRYRLFAAVYSTVGPAPRITLEDPSPAGVRVTPSARFSGKVDVEIIDLTETAQVPLLLAIAPESGPPETAVTLTGMFLLDTTAVRFGIYDALFAVVDDNTVQAIVPAAAVTAPVFVDTPAGTAEGPTFTVTGAVELDVFSFRRTIAQPADGSDFFASFPVAQPNTLYAAHAEVIAGGVGVDFLLPNVAPTDRTINHLRVVTSAPLPNGAVLELTATKPGA